MSPGERSEATARDVEDAYEDAPCGFLATDPDGMLVRANRTFLAWCGYEADELVGRKRFYDLLPPGAKIYYETHYAPLLRMQRHVRELALEVIRADGTRLPVLVNAKLREDEHGAPALVHITVFDATDRRRYERALLEARTAAEERAAAASALAHVAEAVVLVDDDGVVRVANAAAGRLLGRSDDELVGSGIAALVPGWDSVARHVGTDPEATPAVVPLALEGGTRWVAASAAAAPDGVVYTLRDVTAERRLDEVRNDIVAIVSHELRTPLAGVYGAAETLRARGTSLADEQRDALLAVISEQAGRLRRILDGILLTQRLDTGGVVPERRSFDAARATRRVVEGARTWATDHRLELAVEGEAVAEGDEHLFEQVLTNLVDNAVKYSPRGTTVTVGAERRERAVRVVVADEGPGVPEPQQQRIFEKFHRLDPDQLTGAGGTGLGLYIARELVERMHGRIGLLPSQHGAVFFVDLPAAAEA